MFQTGQSYSKQMVILQMLVPLRKACSGGVFNVKIFEHVQYLCLCFVIEPGCYVKRSARSCSMVVVMLFHANPNHCTA